MANGSTPVWGADGPISMPEPPQGEADRLVSFGGFAFGVNGLVPDLSDSDLQDYLLPFFAPVNPAEEA